ncbi:MAG: DUF3108 domain-containing protein [Flavobacteriales bacterium]|nr:DUF3108 domain-containing protein [Flavobacteriales bacterium]
MRSTTKIFSSVLFVLALSVGVKGQMSKPKLVSLDTLPSVELPTVNNISFKAGEELRYRLHYGFVDAGEATITVSNAKKKANGRDLLHIVGEGRTLGAFNWFYKVHDRYESFVDKEGLFPWEFVRRVNEGGYKINQDYKFHQDKTAVDNGEGKTFQTPLGVQDMISTFYYARTMDFSSLNEGDVISIDTFMDDELFTLNVKYLGKDKIKIRAGKFNCLKFVPVVQEGRVFKSSEDLQVWITDDANRIPILVKAKILVGSIKMEVVEFEGLANPIAKID